MTKEETYRENLERCKSISDTLYRYANGDMYECPHCGGVHPFTEYEATEHQDEDGSIFYTCPNCGDDMEEYELEAVSVWHYFNDVFDIEYRAGSNREYRSVRIMVACGGPNIYIDTAKSAVILHWWTESAIYPLSTTVCDEIDAHFQEMYNC